MAHAARFIGQRLPRREDARLLVGRGTFVDDVVLPGMMHGAFHRSTIAHGEVRSIDAEAALRLPGVFAVITAKDLEPMKLGTLNGFPVADQQTMHVAPLATDRVRYVGDPVALVLAESRRVAEDAAALIMIDYAELEPLVTMEQARGGAAIHEGFEGNVAAVLAIPEDPEIEKILASAPHVEETVVTHQRVAHCAMESRGVVVSRNGENELTVWCTSQGTQSIVRSLSDIFDIPATSIRVNSKDVGGSFGLKSRPWREETAVIAAGILLGRPIKWVEDRYENLISANQARGQHCTLRTAFDKDGRLLASKFTGSLDNGAYPHYLDSNAGAAMGVWTPYKMPKYTFVSDGIFTNTVGIAAYRGPWAMESLIRETQLDLAARKLGIDPIEIRRRNLVTSADLPITNLMGIPIEDITPMECLDELLKHIDVAAFRREQAEQRKQGRYRGIGVTTYIEPTATSLFAPMATEVAIVRIEPTGLVTAALGTHSQGQGTQTTMAQIVADRLGVPFEQVSVYEDSSTNAGYGYGAGGSRQAVSGGGAAVQASERLAAKVKELAAHLLNASPEAVTIEDGKVKVEGAPEMTRSIREIAEVAYGEPHRLPPGMEPGLEAQFRYNAPPITFASAAHACVVEVDIETGFVQIERWVGSEDCGVVINPGVVEGQIAGGLTQAIGMVLHERIHFDEHGNPQTATFKDYHLPQISDVPDFEYAHVVTPAKGAGGFRGVGEGGAIIGPPTLVNAIHDALAPFGVTCLDLPLTPAKLLALIERGRAAV
jgi:carbon-monoxide dehydrogenase large subunit